MQEIFRNTAHEKQVMMFSATISKDIQPVCKKFMQDVIIIMIISLVVVRGGGGGATTTTTTTITTLLLLHSHTPHSKIFSLLQEFYLTHCLSSLSLSLPNSPRTVASGANDNSPHPSPHHQPTIITFTPLPSISFHPILPPISFHPILPPISVHPILSPISFSPQYILHPRISFLTPTHPSPTRHPSAAAAARHPTTVLPAA